MAEEKRSRPPRKKPDRIPRQSMPVRAPEERIQDFEEVTLGFDAELAQKEAQRCLQCPKQPCVDGCPVSVDITSFIHLIAEGDVCGIPYDLTCCKVDRRPRTHRWRKQVRGVRR